MSIMCVQCSGRVIWEQYEYGWFIYCVNCGRDSYPDYKGTGVKRPISGRTETTPVFKGDEYYAAASKNDYDK